MNTLHYFHIQRVIDRACERLEATSPGISITGALLKTKVQEEMAARPEITGVLAPVYEVLLKDPQLMGTMQLKTACKPFPCSQEDVMELAQEEGAFVIHTNREGNHLFAATGDIETNLLYVMCVIDNEISKTSGRKPGE